jgi:hypothetical protein
VASGLVYALAKQQLSLMSVAATRRSSLKRSGGFAKTLGTSRLRGHREAKTNARRPAKWPPPRRYATLRMLIRVLSS